MKCATFKAAGQSYLVSARCGDWLSEVPTLTFHFWILRTELSEEAEKSEGGKLKCRLTK